MNHVGLFTLVERETKRFGSVWGQTVLAPIFSTCVFLIIFFLIFFENESISNQGKLFFIAPGAIMMAVIQNAFANTSFSILISKIQGNIVDTLMPPLSSFELLLGLSIGGTIRGLIIGSLSAILIFPLIGLTCENIFLFILYILLASFELSLLGIMAGIFCEKFDHLNGITNFIITPLAFLSGTFYSINVLPEYLQNLCYLNPVFWLIDGARFGALNFSDMNIFYGIMFTLVFIFLLFAANWILLFSGVRLKN